MKSNLQLQKQNNLVCGYGLPQYVNHNVMLSVKFN